MMENTNDILNAIEKLKYNNNYTIELKIHTQEFVKIKRHLITYLVRQNDECFLDSIYGVKLIVDPPAELLKWV